MSLREIRQQYLAATMSLVMGMYNPEAIQMVDTPSTIVARKGLTETQGALGLAEDMEKAHQETIDTQDSIMVEEPEGKQAAALLTAVNLENFTVPVVEAEALG